VAFLSRILEGFTMNIVTRKVAQFFGIDAAKLLRPVGAGRKRVDQAAPPTIGGVARRLLAFMLATAPILAGGDALGQGNLVTNGSFELGLVIPSPGFLELFQGDQTSLDGWTVTRGSIDLVGPNWSLLAGDRAIDLDGSPGHGGVQQTIATVPGVQHTIAFLLSGNSRGERGIKRMRVRAGALIHDFEFDTTGHTLGSMGWTPQFMNFVPTEAQTELEFFSLSDPATNYGPAIDDVIVRPCFFTDMDDGSGGGTPDGGVTIDDLLYYITIFAQGAVRADVDDGSGTGTPDGGVTIDDLIYYLTRFEAGC
jgi:choice-of-anchor C domain-containing protein